MDIFSFHTLALISVIIFALVHLWTPKSLKYENVFHGRFLSMSGGVSIAYVFIELLPKLCKSDFIVSHALSGIFPYFERHVYIFALSGFLLFFAVDRSQTTNSNKSFLLSLGSYALFNFLVGYAVTDKNDPEIRPLALFTIAMALHYFINDYALSEAHGNVYKYIGKWILIAALFLGWVTGIYFSLSATAVALLGAFIAGGVIMNVIRHELPVDNPHSLWAFLLGTGVYTAILLAIG